MTAAALTPNTVDWLLALSQPPHVDPAHAPPATVPLDTHALLNALIRNGTVSLALRRLDSFPELGALEPVLRAAHTRNALWALASMRHIAAVGQALDADRVPWCVLKGVPLALRHYGDLAARRVGDIDILVPPQYVRAADAALAGCGWRRVGLNAEGPLPAPRYWHEQRYLAADDMTLELHHRLHPNPHLLTLPTGKLLDRAEHLSLGGTRVPVLDPVAELLYLSTHGSRHAWYRLLWVCDIAVISANAPPGLLEQTFRVAVRMGLLQPLAQALLLAERLLATPAPPWTHALHRRSRRQRRLLAFAQESLWSARDAAGNPIHRTHSSLISALCQRASMRFWAWELALRARHDWLDRPAPA